MFAPLRDALCQLTLFALHLRQRLLFFAEEARVLNLRGIGERCERFESHVNPNLSIRWVEALRLTLHREADVPFACRGASDGAGFDGALHGTVIHHLETAYLGEADTGVVRDAETRLRKGETIVAISATEAGEPWFLSRLHAPEEGFHRQINPYGHILP